VYRERERLPATVTMVTICIWFWRKKLSEKYAPTIDKHTVRGTRSMCQLQRRWWQPAFEVGNIYGVNTQELQSTARGTRSIVLNNHGGYKVDNLHSNMREGIKCSGHGVQEHCKGHEEHCTKQPQLPYKWQSAFGYKVIDYCWSSEVQEQCKGHVPATEVVVKFSGFTG